MVTMFIKTYAKDFPWLHYCLKSIKKYAHGFDRLVVAANQEDIRTFMGNQEWMNMFNDEAINLELKLTEPYMDGYIGQQIAKIKAYEICHQKNGIILFMDSDCILIDEMSVDDYIEHDNRIHILMTRYDEMRDPVSGLTDVPWQPITEQFMRMGAIEFEYMRRHPLVYWAKDLKDFEEHILDVYSRSKIKHSDSLKGILDQMTSFSEFNAIGAYLHMYRDAYYRFINTATEEIPPNPVKQYWSHGGMTDKIRTDIEARLK